MMTDTMFTNVSTIQKEPDETSYLNGDDSTTSFNDDLQFDQNWTRRDIESYQTVNMMIEGLEDKNFFYL